MTSLNTSASLPRDLTLIDINEVCRMTALSHTSIYRMMKGNQFPQSHALGTRTVRWLKTDVEDWIADRVGLARRNAA